MEKKKDGHRQSGAERQRPRGLRGRETSCMYVAVLCVTSYWQQTKHFCPHRSVLFVLCAFVDMSFKPSWCHFILVFRVPQIQPVGGLGCWLPCCPAVCRLPSMSSISGTVRCPTPPPFPRKPEPAVSWGVLHCHVSRAPLGCHCPRPTPWVVQKHALHRVLYVLRSTSGVFMSIAL